jgi:Tat protein secretion system quality control protein TatD with DNase activity
MGTRAQDQALVAEVADTHGVKSNDVGGWEREECVVPCFGWHPWFAHMMYIDKEEEEWRRRRDVLQNEAKIKHYQNVLHPHREDPISEKDREVFLSLPDPMSFSGFLEQTRAYLEKYPFALVGEIGLGM